MAEFKMWMGRLGAAFIFGSLLLAFVAPHAFERMMADLAQVFGRTLEHVAVVTVNALVVAIGPVLPIIIVFYALYRIIRGPKSSGK